MHHLNTNPNWQVKAFTDTFLNIMSNFIPNDTKKFVPRNPPWITKPLKSMLNRKNRLLNNYTVIKLRIKLGWMLFVLTVNKRWKLLNYRIYRILAIK